MTRLIAPRVARLPPILAGQRATTFLPHYAITPERVTFPTLKRKAAP